MVPGKVSCWSWSFALRVAQAVACVVVALVGRVQDQDARRIYHGAIRIRLLAFDDDGKRNAEPVQEARRDPAVGSSLRYDVDQKSRRHPSPWRRRRTAGHVMRAPMRPVTISGQRYQRGSPCINSSVCIVTETTFTAKARYCIDAYSFSSVYALSRNTARSCSGIQRYRTVFPTGCPISAPKASSAAASLK